MRLKLAWVAVIAVIAPAAMPGFGQAPESTDAKFEPITAAEKPLYHFNFTRNFFADPAAEKAARPKVYAAFADLEKHKGKLAQSPASLLAGLRLYDEALRRVMRHAVYLYLQYATNTKNTAANEAQSKLFADLNTRTSFMQQELMRIEPAKWLQFTKQEPVLKNYAFSIESARRLKPHTLTLKEEELLSALAPHLNDWPGELYQKSLDRTTWAKIASPQGELDVRRQRGAITNSPDRGTREAGFKKVYEGYRTHRDLYAYALTKQVKARNQVSKIRRYRDFPHEAHFGLFLETPQVKSLFERMAQQGGFNKRYQKLRADRIRKIAGFDDINVWDLSVIPPGQARPRFTIADAKRRITAALAPLGSEYRAELAELFDPKQGRLDLVPGENRVPGAFAWGFPGAQTSIFYSFNFEGYFQDVSTLAHEAGHAVHFEMMANSKVLPPFTSGPTYFTESFAMFNELLLADNLYKQEKDLFRKTFFLEQFLTQAMGVFAITRQASIEQAVYDAVQADKIKGADDLDALAKKVGTRFSLWFEKHDDLKMEWIDVHHFFEQPMYYVNYVFANFLALKYYEFYQRNPGQFVPKFMAMVRSGFNDTPANILKRYLAVDLKDPRLVSGAFSILESKVRELESLYGRSTTAARRTDSGADSARHQRAKKGARQASENLL